VKRTIKLELPVSPKVFLPTIDAYTKAYNFVCSVGFSQKDFNQFSLHYKTYKILTTYLPAQFAISSRMKAYETLKSVKHLIKKDKIECPKSKRCSIRYDARSFTTSFDKNMISLLTINGRVKVPIQVPKYFQKYLTWRRKSAELFIRKNKVYINIVFDKSNPEVKPSGITIGIDRGINNIAVASNNKFYSGKQVKRICNKYNKLKSSLQSCGSKSAKRHLKKLSGRENRFKTDANHRISKEIIANLPEGSVIVLEDLRGIRSKKRGKKLNKMIGTWTYFQLEQFLTYKAEEKGIQVVKVDPHFTSQKCSKCGHTEKKNRIGNNFKCCACGFRLNADLNASRNILQLHLVAISNQTGVSVNNPIVSTQHFVELETSH